MISSEQQYVLATLQTTAQDLYEQADCQLSQDDNEVLVQLFETVLNETTGYLDSDAADQMVDSLLLTKDNWVIPEA